MLADHSRHRAFAMRLPALIALAALVGLAACDSAKVSELTGAKPPAPQAAACPPTPNPACPSVVAVPPSMPPEAGASLPAAVPPTAAVAKARRAAWTAPRPQHVRRAVVHRARVAAAHAPVRHNAYAGGYVGESAPPRGHGRHDGAYAERRYKHPPVYARPDEDYDRRAYAYERREEGSDQGGYRYERRESSGHAPYVDDQAYRYEHREDAREAYRYERREEGYSSSHESSGGSYSTGGAALDCNCRAQAAGRDRQGLLTWPGKQP
jgi:hypothetical protein